MNSESATSAPASSPASTATPGDLAGTKHVGQARQGVLTGLGARLAFPFIWVAMLARQFTLTSALVIATIIGTLACGWLAIVMLTPTTLNTVQFEHGKVEDKGWFGNLLWRADQSKIFNVSITTDNAPFTGGDVQQMKVTAERASGEVTTYTGNGVWKTIKEAN